MKKNVFITGAAGFIGFHLAKFLHNRGDHVLGFDNFNDYYSPKLKQDRAEILRKQGITIVKGDICDLPLLQSTIETHKTSHIVNLAAQAGVRYSITNPQAYIKSNLHGFVNVLEVCKNLKNISLVYASSSSVYGTNAKIPFSVKDSTDHQASLYGVTKKSNELMAQTYHHLFGIPVTGLRFFTAYGPWGRPDMAYYSFTKAIVDDRPIEVFNNGFLKRDFTYIDDIISGISAALDLGAQCELFNLGNHQPIELIQFIKILEIALGKNAKKAFLPMQAGDVLITYADIDYSREKLGFEPKISLEQGIANFVKWYKEYEK
jgi:UDP-glucuronate 4-epimerase